MDIFTFIILISTLRANVCEYYASTIYGKNMRITKLCALFHNDIHTISFFLNYITHIIDR